MSDLFLADLWRGVRGDMPLAEFERWLYDNANELESRLGQRTALEVLAADFRSRDTVVQIKHLLRDFAECSSVLDCRCSTLSNVSIVDMGEDEGIFTPIQRRRSRGEPYWWLWCGECSVCGQWWLIGQEERQNDVLCLRRLDDAEAARIIDDDVWPADFDSYESLLRLGLDAGRRAKFLDPERALSLHWTIVDLARARPGIRPSELAELLNLDLDTTLRLAARAVAAERVVIDSIPVRR